MPGIPESKTISVVVKLSRFAALNGDLSRVVDARERERFVRRFFLQKYGTGGGKLDVKQREGRAKLIWQAPTADATAEQMHQKALEAAKRRQYQEAVNLWVRAISLNPNDPDFYFNLGIAFFELKNYKESVENLKRALSLCPIYHRAHLILGTVYLKTRKFQEAETHLVESIVFYPNHPLAYLNLGAVYSILKRYDEGIKMFMRTLELSPNEVRAHFGLGKIYSITGNPEKANQYFKNVIDLDKNGQLAIHAKRAMLSTPADIQQVQPTAAPTSANVEKYYQQGYRSFLFADYEKAALMYGGYLKNKPDDDFVWYSLAESYLRLGKIQKAVEAYEKAIALNASKALYHKGLAVAYSYLDQNQKVIDCAEKARKLGKNDSILNTLLGKSLINQQNLSDAVQVLETALEQNCNNLLAKYQLAIAYMKTGQVDLATNYLQEIARSPVKTPIKMEAQALLGKLQRA